MGGSLTENEILEYKKSEKHQNIKNFVETGTYQGETTRLVSNYFDNVYTIEIMETLFRNSIISSGGEHRIPNGPLIKGTIVNVYNMNFMYGDSVEMLKVITPLVKDGSIFFIDAHQSGCDTGNNGTWVPLMEELEIILSTRLGPSIFIFDDVRLWKQKFWDWAHIDENRIFQIFEKFNYTIEKSYELNDRFWIFTL